MNKGDKAISLQFPKLTYMYVYMLTQDYMFRTRAQFVYL